MNLKLLLKTNSLKEYKGLVKSLKLFSIFLLMLFLVNVVSAPIDTYQVDNSNSGLLTTEPYGAFDANVDHSYSTANGDNYQPLIDDINNDGQYEVIIYDSSRTLIKILNSNAVPIAEYEIKGTGYCKMALTDFDSDNIKEIQYCTNWNVSAVEWNTTHWTKVFTYPISKGGTVFTAIKCSATNCFMALENTSSIPRDLIVKYNLSGSSINRIKPGSTGFSLVSYSSPALYDIEALSDNALELIFLCDSDGDAKYGICVYDTNSNVLDTYFSADGILDDLAYTTDWISNPLVYNIDGFGSAEIIYTTASTLTFRISMLTGTGSAKYTDAEATLTNGNCASDAALSYNPLVVKDTLPGICALGIGSTTNRVLLCVNYDLTTAGIDKKFTASTDVNAQRMPILSIPISTPAPGGGNVINHQILTSRYLLDENFDFFQTNLTGSDLYYAAAADVNQDGSLDLVFSKSGRTIISYSSYENGQASFVDRSLGLSPYGMPICTGTTVTFSAIECGTEPCHYVNELGDDERLISSCGINYTSYFNGTFADSHPTLSCTFSNVGDYNFNIYLQDTLHKTDFTEYQSRLINVVNGTPNVNCNLPASDEQESGESLGGATNNGSTLTQSDIDYITNTLTGGGSTLVKTILAFAMILGTIILLVKWNVNNPVIYAIAIFVELILGAVVGIVSWAIIILIGFMILLFSGIMWAVGGNN